MGDPTRSNDLRERFDAGDAALGVLDNTYSPTLVEFFGELGCDFVWLDLEHGGPSAWDGERLEAFCRAADRGETELLVRLPTVEPAGVRKALDAGVRNVFLPRVETVEEVRRAVAAGRFRYDGGPGERGLASPRARRWGLADDYVDREDRETLVGATVETREALDALEEVLAVPELGFVFVGPLDLSVQLDHPDDLDHPDVEAAVETVREAAIDAGVPVAGLGFGVEDVNRKLDAGYQLVNLGSTTGALRGVVTDWLDAVER